MMLHDEEDDREVLTAKALNESFIKIECGSGTGKELAEYFKFRVPGYFYMPAYKCKKWDGYLRLFNLANNTLYRGLTPYLVDFCKRYKYQLNLDQKLGDKNNFTNEQVQAFSETLSLPYEARDYQIEAVKQCLNNKRQVLVSATASGKSLIIYLLSRVLKGKKILIIVPTISLVHQMLGDFSEYSQHDFDFDIDTHCHKIFQGQDKNSDAKIYCSTWQSIYKQDRKYFEQFDVVIGDECHQAKADALKLILEKCVNAEYRFGFTGTLDEAKIHRLVIEGLFGKVFTATTSKDLMDKGHLASLSINCVMLKYTEEECRLARGIKYADELKYIVSHKKRNRFVANLAMSTKGNTLILFQFVEKHGKVLFDILQDKCKDTDRKVFFIHGKVDSELREEVRHLVESEPNAIIVASSGVFSTGVNIKNIENLILASPTKSKIKTLQSIGRSLRVGRSSEAVLYDIVDDLSYKTRQNYAMKHFAKRTEIYNSEKFKYKFAQIIL